MNKVATIKKYKAYSWGVFILIAVSTMSSSWAGGLDGAPVQRSAPLFNAGATPIVMSDNGNGLTLEQATAKARKVGRIIRVKTVSSNGHREYHIRVLDDKGRLKNLRYRAKANGGEAKRRDRRSPRAKQRPRPRY